MGKPVLPLGQGPQALTDQQQEGLLEVRLACPDITRACDLARALTDLVRNRRGSLLFEWIRQAEQDAPKPMSGFAGFRADYRAWMAEAQAYGRATATC